MPAALYVNGTSLEELGCYLFEHEGVEDTVETAWDATPVHESAGVLLTDPVDGARKLTLQGLVKTVAQTVTARREAVDLLKDLLRAGRLRLVRDDGVTAAREIEGYLRRMTVRLVGGPHAATDARVTIQIDCDGPYWRALTPRLLGLTVSGKRYPLPLGTAPSAFLLNIMGPVTDLTTVDVEYRDAGGALRRQMQLTGALTSTEYLQFDMRRRKVLRFTDGVAANGRNRFLSGDLYWPFDPQDGDVRSQSWPTLSITNAEAEALWWEQYQ